jgi:hypothetical protein
MAGQISDTHSLILFQRDPEGPESSTNAIVFFKATKLFSQTEKSRHPTT